MLKVRGELREWEDQSSTPPYLPLQRGGIGESFPTNRRKWKDFIIQRGGIFYLRRLRGIAKPEKGSIRDSPLDLNGNQVSVRPETLNWFSSIA